MVAVENQKINRNEIWKKCVCLAKVMRNGMKLLGGSGQGVEKGLSFTAPTSQQLIGYTFPHLRCLRAARGFSR